MSEKQASEAEQELMPAQESGAQESEPQETETAPTNGWLESVYSRFDGVPLRVLDIFIGVCVVLFIAVIAVGIMKARGIL